MIYVAYHPSGRIQQCGSCHEADLEYQGGPETTKMAVPELIDPSAFYVDVGVILPMPERPSGFHDFNYTTKQWVPNHERAWSACRYQRDQLLSATDWRVTKAMESGVPLSAEWVAYRQALRDVTSQADPINIDWPVAPS